MATLDIARLPDEIGANAVPVAVVVDVLRATTTIAAMLDAGAESVRPVGSIDEALTRRGSDPGAIAAGERGGVPPVGFDLGNSPLAEAVGATRGRRVVLSTTNGTRAVVRAAGVAELVLALSLTNIDAVAAALGRIGRDCLVVCSGTDGKHSDEDELAAGLLADRMHKHAWGLSAAAGLIRDESVSWVERLGGIEGAVRRSFHAQRLIGLGFEADVVFCAQLGVTETVPTLEPGSPAGPAAGSESGSPAGGCSGVGVFVRGYDS